MKCRGTAALLLVLLVSGWAMADGGKLDQVRRDVNPLPREPDRFNDRHSDSDWDDDCDDDDFLGSLIGDFLCLLLSPGSGGGSSGHDPDDPVDWFLRNPYAAKQDGYMRFMTYKEVDQLIASAPPRKMVPQSYSFRFALEDSHNLDDVNQLQGQLWLEGQGGLGFYTSWNWLHENLPGDHTDNLVLGKLHFTGRAIALERFQLRTGIGLNMLGGDGHSNWGMNFMLDADVFPKRPWIISAQVDGGWVGDAGLFHTRLTTGLIYRHCEGYLGYDYLRLGSVDLHGPVAGIRFWY